MMVRRRFSVSAERQILLQDHFFQRLEKENIDSSEHAKSRGEAIVSVLTLNRPKANAMGRVFLEQLNESLDDLEERTAEPCPNNKSSSSGSSISHHDFQQGELLTSSPRCVIIRSHSYKVFSAGADLKERANMSMEQAEDFVAHLRFTMERLSRLPIPVIAAVEGVALGGGLELALAADLMVLSEAATVGLPETSLAIVPGAGGTQRLARRIGASRAKQLIWTAARLDGRTAVEQFGIGETLVPKGQSYDVAMDWAQKMAQHGPVAIRASKWAIDTGMEASSMPEALEIERQAYARVLPTEDRLEGLAAFKEGRTPFYKGK